MSCKDEETRNGAKLPNGETKSPAEKREELLNEFRKLGNYDPDLPADSALTELEAEADASDFAMKTPNVCWQRSARVMPRIRIVTELENYLVPWMHITLIKTDPSRKIIEIETSMGITFSIVSRTRQDALCALLQLERVKMIRPAEGVRVKANLQTERDE